MRNKGQAKQKVCLETTSCLSVFFTDAHDLSKTKKRSKKIQPANYSVGFLTSYIFLIISCTIYLFVCRKLKHIQIMLISPRLTKNIHSLRNTIYKDVEFVIKWFCKLVQFKCFIYIYIMHLNCSNLIITKIQRRKWRNNLLSLLSLSRPKNTMKRVFSEWHK